MWHVTSPKRIYICALGEKRVPLDGTEFLSTENSSARGFNGSHMDTIGGFLTAVLLVEDINEGCNWIFYGESHV